MHDLLNLIKGQADQQTGQLGVPRIGVVTSVDPTKALVRVTREPDHSTSKAEGGPDVLTGWLPVVMPALGPSWGIVSLPAPGQQVLVLPDSGQAEHGVVVGSLFSTKSVPPNVPSAPGGGGSNAQPGEALLVSQAGAVLRLCADGTIYMQAAQVNVAGDLHVMGDVYDRHGSLDRLRQNYTGHDHAKSVGSTTRPDPE